MRERRRDGGNRREEGTEREAVGVDGRGRVFQVEETAGAET